MEWKKVKTLLICVIVCANLFLAGNIWIQAAQNRGERRIAFENSLDTLEQTVGEFDREIFNHVEKRASTIYLKREESLEAKLAQELIASDSEGSVGGGIRVFTSANGKATFRNGGALNITWQEEISLPIGDWFEKKLASAGLDLREAEIEQAEDGVLIRQKNGGRIVENATLLCTYKNGICEIRGTWVQGKALEQVACKTGYEMILQLNDYFEQNNIEKMADKIEIVYFVDGKEDSEIVLTPAWKISTGEKTFYLNCETGKEKIFDASDSLQ